MVAGGLAAVLLSRVRRDDSGGLARLDEGWGCEVEDVNRAVIEAYWQAIRDGDMHRMADAYTDDAIQQWPQSGERVVGKANILAITENYPGLPKATVRRLVGSGDLWVSEVTLEYGGDRYEAVSILEMRDGKIARETDYFAAPFEAPQWRAQWTERL